MDDRQAFKYGFLTRCASQGLTPDQVLERVRQGREKLASFSGILGSLAGGAKSVADKALGVGIPAALAAPPILGGLAGLTAARMSSTDDTDASDIRDQEKIDAYRRAAQQLTQLKQRRHQEAGQRPKSVHF